MSSQTVEKSFFYRREHLYDPNLLPLGTGELLERTAMCGLEESTDAGQDFSIVIMKDDYVAHHRAPRAIWYQFA